MSTADLAFEPRLRVVIDTDAKNEADDQFAIAHALLSPSFDLRGLVAAHFGFRRSPTSMRDSREEIELLLRLSGRSGLVRVADGAPHPLPDAKTPVDSPGARLIVEEAMRDEEAPLAVAFLGPLTDLASALLLEPRIVERDLTAIWIGGPPYAGFGSSVKAEFNLSNDLIAANVVFASSLRVWQIPQSTYRTMNVGYAELYEHVRPCGELGRYLVDQLVEFNRTHLRDGRAMECRSLGDSPAIGVMLAPGCGWWSERPAPGFCYDGSYDERVEHRPIRVYHSIDARFVLADLFAKLRAHAASNAGRPMEDEAENQPTER